MPIVKRKSEEKNEVKVGKKEEKRNQPEKHLLIHQFFKQHESKADYEHNRNRFKALTAHNSWTRKQSLFTISNFESILKLFYFIY